MNKRLIALLGHPVAHSKSPYFQNAAFKALNLTYYYVACDVVPKNLQDAVLGLKALGFGGANVTIPHKVAITPFLDELTPLAKKIGAVNTLFFRDGNLVGDNTDGRGYMTSLLEENPSLCIEDMSVGIVGAGGSARALAFTLIEYGVKRLYITNRHEEKSKQLIEELKEWGIKTTVLESIPFVQFHKVTSTLDLLIHTTPVGMVPKKEDILIPEYWIHPNMIVSDLIYNPLETALLKKAKERGAKAHSGMGMLLHQGALSFELWTNEKAPLDKMKAALLSRM